MQLTSTINTTPLNVPLENGKPMPLQNGHFPTHFIKNKKVVQIQDWPSVMNEQGKGYTTHFIAFFMKWHFLYMQIPEMIISGMSYLLKNVVFW